MTEVPDYLLERSRERRRALTGGGDGDGGDAGPAAATPAAVKSAAPVAALATAAAAPAAVEPPKPDDPWVAAAKSRHKIPLWILPVLFLLPLWAIVYVQLLGENEVEAVTALSTGAGIYASSGCAGCHGAAGGGGVGYQLSEGEVLKTFASARDMIPWITAGTEDWGIGNAIGDPNREGGARLAGDRAPMPGFGASLTEADVFAVARYIREQLSGEELDAEEIEALDLEWEELGGGGSEHG
ncbi:MAG: c-type cytochrome [Actinobacteria bacterium]|nr:c-type cytochrome [Actinomycetota bacterium]